MTDEKTPKWLRWRLNFQIRWGWRMAGRITRRAILSRSHARRERLMARSDEARAEVYALQDLLMETYGIRGYMPPPEFFYGLSVAPRRDEKHLKLLWVVE